MRWLRTVFDRLAVLREAEALLGGLLIMPGPDGRRTVALLTEAGLHLDSLGNDADARRIITRYRTLLGDAQQANRGRRLGGAVVDCLCTAARQLRQPDHAHHLVPPEDANRLDAPGLLRLSFPAGKRSGQEPTLSAGAG